MQPADVVRLGRRLRTFGRESVPTAEMTSQKMGSPEPLSSVRTASPSCLSLCQLPCSLRQLACSLETSEEAAQHPTFTVAGARPSGVQADLCVSGHAHCHLQANWIPCICLWCWLIQSWSHWATFRIQSSKFGYQI